MGGLETLLERTDMHSPRMRTLHLTSASRTSFRTVRYFLSFGLQTTDSSLRPDVHHGGNAPTRHVELDIDIGADAKDWNAIQAGEKLKPVEMELRRIEEVTAEIVKEMEYLREREMSLRDTNESTNERVKWFAIGTMGILVGFGAWQVIYLRAYFRFVMILRFEFICFADNFQGPSISFEKLSC